MLAVCQAEDARAQTVSTPAPGSGALLPTRAGPACHWLPQVRLAGGPWTSKTSDQEKGRLGQDPGTAVIKGPGALCTSRKPLCGGGGQGGMGLGVEGAAKSLWAQPGELRSARREDRVKSKHEKVKSIRQPQANALGLPKPACSFPLRLQTSALLASPHCQPTPPRLPPPRSPGPALLPCPHLAHPAHPQARGRAVASGAEGPTRAARGFSSWQTGMGCLQGIPRDSANGGDGASEPRRRVERVSARWGWASQ